MILQWKNSIKQMKMMNMNNIIKFLTDNTKTNEVKIDYIYNLNQDDLSDIEEALKYFSDSYYGNNGVIINDTVYNEIENLWKVITGKKELDFVPGEQIKKGEEVVIHKIPLLSLGKINDIDVLIDKVKRMLPCMLQLKIDGGKMAFYPNLTNKTMVVNFTKYLAPYIAGTRGNHGVKGIDKTLQCYYTGKIRNIYNTPVMGEGYVKKSSLKYINSILASRGEKTYENCRNAFIGIMNAEHSEFIQFVDFFIYNIIGSTMSQSQQLNWIYNAGLPTLDPRYVLKINTEEDVPKVLQYVEYIKSIRDQLDFDIDGIVIKSNEPNSLEKYGGCTAHHPKDAFAFKFESQGTWTVLKDVVWQVGRTGTVNPVAKFDPINIMGANISSATLHNVSFMKMLNVKIGSKIFVVKKNDIIPAVEEAKDGKNMHDIEIPIECPSCASPLQYKGKKLYCTNNNCEGMISNGLLHLAEEEALNIKGLGEKTAEKLVELGLVNKVTDIFYLTEEDFIKVCGKTNGKKLFKQVKNCREDVPLSNFIYSCGINTVGIETAKDLAKTFKTLNNFIDVIRNEQRHHEITDIDGIAQITAYKIINSKTKIVDLMTFVSVIDVSTHFNPVNSKPQINMTVCITGTLSKERKAIEKDLGEYGIKVSKTVTKKTHYLVKGEDPGKSKIEDAESKNIPIISENKLSEIIKCYEKGVGPYI